ncbi:MAG: diguanylate cyclase [Alphaproteobacteria bacterium]|nr:diguanylate cyclase [Alphaproteobacteria bacterium]NCQ87877.1 diguanylate cyclase [Alphaproteobacteria bacterium]NCT05615.1 diguanylate cyclase [Alphaproteobacteria bacterium]
MSPDIQTKPIFEELANIIDEHIEWFGHLCVAVAYANDRNTTHGAVMPDSFGVWLEKIRVSKTFPKTSIQTLAELHDDLGRHCEMTLQKVHTGSKPELKAFEDFKQIFDGFIIRLLRLEREEGFDESGINAQTNMRSEEFMLPDMKKEMERVARQGKPFTLVYTRVDDFESISDKVSALQLVSKHIKRCLRSFDDAYYLENGQFVLSLKQSDIFGAQAATMRLQQGLRGDDSNNGVSMSFCIAEPVPEDDIEALIGNMRDDLAKYDTERDIVLKFLEVSPLQRYIEAIG